MVHGSGTGRNSMFLRHDVLLSDTVTGSPLVSLSDTGHAAAVHRQKSAHQASLALVANEALPDPSGPLEMCQFYHFFDIKTPLSWPKDMVKSPIFGHFVRFYRKMTSFDGFCQTLCLWALKSEILTKNHENPVKTTSRPRRSGVFSTPF